MRWGGIIIGLFIVYHLLHMTTGTLLAGHGGHEHAYANVILAFTNPLATLMYLIAMIALGLHLNHGVWSVAQTLGLRTGDNNGAWRGLSIVSAIAIAGGFSIVPLAVLFRFVQ